VTAAEGPEGAQTVSEKDATPAMPMCPDCGETHVGRVKRHRLERLLSVLYVYPFRCRICGHRFLAVQWGQRYDTRSVDRREYERLATQMPVAFGADEMDGEGVVTEISIDGCTIQTETAVSRGAHVPLRMQCSPTRTITIAHAVVRSVHGRSFGVQFVQLSAREHDAIHRLVCELLAVQTATPRRLSANPLS
jgi:predicted RNA-binding Zn-ribbon protein involved in translation (DUF1610 family)